MSLVLYDTLHREKRVFEPRDPNRVTLYVCGPTVYDHAHIGNARPPVVFDVLVRLLRRQYGADKVIYARNVTDVDDKINQRASALGMPIGEITAKYEAHYLADMARLNVAPPDLAPHVTDHMDAIVKQIAAIVDAGCAYAAEGHVLFDVSSYPAYGRLSGRNLDDMIAGARVEVAPYKKNAHDFVLWKPSKQGEPSWPSPWGDGRPGWHIECSAMIEENLGLPIDIHGGGIDLVFPHHENEIAQGVCAHGHAHADQAHGQYAKYWMHNGFLTVDAEKMSKSIGNVLLLHDLVQSMPGEVVRWALLSAHYRQPLDWNQSLLKRSKKNLETLARAYERISYHHASHISGTEIESALRDDLNTPRAMSVMIAAAKEILRESYPPAHAVHELLDGISLLGIDLESFRHWMNVRGDVKRAISELVSKRDKAKNKRDWGSADAIRRRLGRLWTSVQDTPTGPVISSLLKEADLEQVAARSFEALWGPVEPLPLRGIGDFKCNIGNSIVVVEVKRSLPSKFHIRKMVEDVQGYDFGDVKLCIALPYTSENISKTASYSNQYTPSPASFVLFDGLGQVRLVRLSEWS